MDTKGTETAYPERSMARFKPYDLNQTKMIPLSYADQVLEGSFEYALNEIVEEHRASTASLRLTDTLAFLSQNRRIARY
jgi:catabolite regulation protein CreA